MVWIDTDPADVFELSRERSPSSDGTGGGIGIAGDPDASSPTVMCLEEEIKPMEGSEVHAAGNGRVHYGFVGGGIPSTGRRVHALDLGNEVRPGALETGRRDEGRCDLRRTRKGGTDVGWRLRADLHHDGGPGSCDPGVACSCLDHSLVQERCRGVSARRDGCGQGAQGGPVRALRCIPGEVLRFSRPMVGCDPVRVLVAGGQG